MSPTGGYAIVLVDCEIINIDFFTTDTDNINLEYSPLDRCGGWRIARTDQTVDEPGAWDYGNMYVRYWNGSGGGGCGGGS